jgi:tetrapyrrole methylase family protein / MazG family protein
MKEFDDVIETTERLLGPNGCPWDRVQTMKSTRPCVIEEGAELVDAIDLDDNDHILEELGDMFFVVLFLSKLAEKEQRCTLKEVLESIQQKLIRRHPHVFGEAKINTEDELLKQWEEIKKHERGKKHRKSLLDSIPKGLPALARAQKVTKKMKEAQYPNLTKNRFDFDTEEQLGKLLLEIAAAAAGKGLDAEHALRKVLVNSENEFRTFENI